MSPGTSEHYERFKLHNNLRFFFNLRECTMCAIELTLHQLISILTSDVQFFVIKSPLCITGDSSDGIGFIIRRLLQIHAKLPLNPNSGFKGMVPVVGLEPTRISPPHFECGTSTIPSHRLVIWYSAYNWMSGCRLMLTAEVWCNGIILHQCVNFKHVFKFLTARMWNRLNI